MPDRAAPPGSPPGNGLEITQEMIRAGLAALYAYDSRFEDETAVVKSIYRAMRAVAPPVERLLAQPR